MCVCACVCVRAHVRACICVCVLSLVCMDGVIYVYVDTVFWVLWAFLDGARGGGG